MADTFTEAINQPLGNEKTIEEIQKDDNLGNPTTPMGSAGLGASPDAAKMAGTKIQKKAAQLAQSRSKDSSKELTQQDRLAQARSARTEAEESAARRAAQLSQLGSLGTRVENLIQSNIAEGLESAEVGVEVGDDDLGRVFTELPSENQPAVLALTNEYYSATPERQQQILADLSNNYGVTVDSSNIDDLVGGIEQATGQSVADLTMDNVRIGDMGAEQLAQMGIADTAEMAELLGVPEAQVAGMSLADLVANVESQQAADFAQVQELQRQLADPATSESERVALRKQLRDLGGVGITGVEQQVESLADVVAEAGTITVGNETMSVEDFLADDNFSKMIVDFLSPETDQATKDDIAARLGKDASDLIEQHSAAIGDLISAGTKGVQTFDATQKKRQDTAQQLITEGRFDPEQDKELLTELFPGWDKAGTGQHEWADSQLYKAVSNPEDVDATLDFLFGEDVKEGTIQAQFDKLKELAALPTPGGFGGDFGNPNAEKLRMLASILDSDGDGTIDTGALIEKLRSEGKGGLLKTVGSLKDALSSAGSEVMRIKAEAAEAQKGIDKDAKAEAAKKKVSTDIDKLLKDLDKSRGPSFRGGKMVMGNRTIIQNRLNNLYAEYEKIHGKRHPKDSRPSAKVVKASEKAKSKLGGS